MIFHKILCSNQTTPESGWLAIANTVGNSATIPTGYFYDLSLDANANVLVGGYHALTPNTAVAAKFDTSGTLIFQNLIPTTTSLISIINGVAFDSSGNSIVVGEASFATTADDYFLITKYNSYGAVVWEQSLYWGTTARKDILWGVTTDSSDNVYVCGQVANTGTNFYGYVAKFNSAGTVQWQYYLTGGTNDNSFKKLVLDSGGNIWCVGTYYASASSDLIWLTKYNSSGTIQLQKSITGDLQRQDLDVAIDSSNNLYIVGSPVGTTYSKFTVTKLNSSAALVWQRQFDEVGTHVNSAFGVCTDTNGNVYAVGRMLSGGATVGLIVKYNSSGTLQWQRTLDNGHSTEVLSVKHKMVFYM